MTTIGKHLPPALFGQRIQPMLTALPKLPANPCKCMWACEQKTKAYELLYDSLHMRPVSSQYRHIVFGDVTFTLWLFMAQWKDKCDMVIRCLSMLWREKIKRKMIVCRLFQFSDGLSTLHSFEKINLLLMLWKHNIPKVTSKLNQYYIEQVRIMVSHAGVRLGLSSYCLDSMWENS